MPKGQQRGNKEAKKIKRAPVPPPIQAGPATVPAHKSAPPRSLKK